MITLYRLPRNKETSKDERNRKICAASVTAQGRKVAGARLLC